MTNSSLPSADQLASEGVLTNRRIQLDGSAVTLRIEQSYWGALDEICRREDMTAEDIICDLARRLRQSEEWQDPPVTSVALANAVRVFIVGYFRQAATEKGHEQAGHGRGAWLLSNSNRLT